MDEVTIINSRQLYLFLKSVLPYYSFELFMHILTNPYLSMLLSLPRIVRESSQVFLDGEKNKINDYAARKLRAKGYTVYYVRRLHGKVMLIGSRPDYIVVGTSNMSSRSFTNYEAVVIIKNPSPETTRSIRDYFVSPVKKASYIPKI